MKTPHPPRSRTDPERGEVLVEFALALTLLLVTMLGTLEFGLAIFRYNMVADLAQEGARWAAVRGSGSGTLAASEADVRTFVQSRSVNISVSVNTSANPSALAAGDTIQVVVSHSFRPAARLLPLPAGVSTLTLRSTAQMVMAR